MPKTRSCTTEGGLLIGIRPLIEAIEARRDIDKIYLQKNLQGSLFQELWSYLKEYQLPYVVVPKNRLDKFTRQNHQGVVAQVSSAPFQDIREIIHQVYERGETPLVVVLDRVSDVRNFGAIARTADAAGAHALLISTKNSAAVNEDAMKTSAGALQHLPLCRESNLNEAIQWLQDYGLRVVACSEKTQSIAFQADLNGPLALIFGSEDLGIAPERLALCDAIVKLPMFGQIASLNVSVAAGALLYQVVNQRYRSVKWLL